MGYIVFTLGPKLVASSFSVLENATGLLTAPDKRLLASGADERLGNSAHKQ